MRTLIVVLLILFTLAPSAHAVTAMCQGGFKPCDPTTGLCYTAWTASHAGQVQANCATDPTTCWRQMMQDPTCQPTEPSIGGPPTVCPPGADCGPSFPINLWGFPDFGAPFQTTREPVWWRNSGGQPGPGSNPAGRVLYCDVVQAAPPHALIEHADALGCAAVSYFDADRFSTPAWKNSPPAIGPYNDFLFGVGVNTGRAVQIRWEDNAFQPPASPCGWALQPTPPGNQCVQAGSPLVLALKVIEVVGGRTTSDRLQERHDEVLRNITRTEQNLKDGLYGTVNSIWGRAERMWRVTMIQEVLQIAQALVDPPNTAYQALPGLPALAAPDTITAGTGMTAAQAAAWNSWAAAHRLYMQAWGRLHDTYDNLAGAMNAHDALWVRRLALAAEDGAADLAATWSTEQSARLTLAAAYPGHPDLGAGCSTPTDVLTRLYAVGANGDRLFGGYLQYQAGLAAPCASTPTTFLAAMTSTPAEIISAFAAPGIRHRVGAATGFDSSRTVTTLKPKQNLVGLINVTATVGAQAGEPYPVKVGDLVHVSIPGRPAVPDAVLGAGLSVIIKAQAPAGTYAVTITYPETRAGKLASSAATVSVMVK